MKKQFVFAFAFLFTLISLNLFALEAKDVVGKWGLDKEKSAAAADGNTAGLMNEVTIKEDGTFEALYGIKGTYKIQDGKFLVTFANSPFRKDEEAVMDGSHLKFPAPAMKDKKCYLQRK